MRAIQSLAAAVVVLLASALIGTSAPSGVSFVRGDNKLDITVAGKPFTTYYYGPELPRPFFHPVRAADGTVVTRGYPMIKDAPGEEKDRDHPHHRSLWFTHGDVNGVDYWGEAGKRPGRIVHRSIDKMSGGREGVLALTMDWIDDKGKKVLVQKEEVVIRGDATRRIIDFAITLTPVDSEVVFGDTKEGSFSMRLATVLKENGQTGTIKNSRGGVGEKQCWGKPAEWVDYSGTLDGKKLGITIFDHPSSFRHPTTWHVRAYGLFAANPFGLHDFTGDKTADGSLKLAPGKTLDLRYRVLIHPGDAAANDLPAEYKRYQQEAH
jgi:hypothetical protein